MVSVCVLCVSLVIFACLTLTDNYKWGQHVTIVIMNPCAVTEWPLSSSKKQNKNHPKLKDRSLWRDFILWSACVAVNQFAELAQTTCLALVIHHLVHNN